MATHQDLLTPPLQLESRWHRRPGAQSSELNMLQAVWPDADVPGDFLTFLQWSNGGQCVTPHGHIDLWSVSDIVDLNAGYQIRRYLGPSVMGIGTDGGSTLITFDLRPSSSDLMISFDLGDLDTSKGKCIATSFTEMLMRLENGQLTDANIYP